jgi:hypothetical protein
MKTADRVPGVLARTPWTHRREPVVIAGLRCRDEVAVDWLPQERAAWAAVRDTSWREPLDFAAVASQVLDATMDYWHESQFFALGPDELTRPLIERWTPRRYTGGEDLKAVVARYELAALPAVLHATKLDTVPSVLEALLPFAGPVIADRVAVLLVNTKPYREEYRILLSWLRRHAFGAARAIVPQALGKAKFPRRRAEQTLNLLAASGPRERADVLAAARSYSDEAAEAVTELLDRLHLEVAADRLPVLPGWADAGTATDPLPPVLLPDAGALPADAVRNLCTMLAMTDRDGCYPALPAAVAACHRGSVAELGRELFERWRAARMPKASEWALLSLRYTGDEDTVRRLAPLLDGWSSRGGAAHAHAVAGVGVIAGIGGDLAQQQLEWMAAGDMHVGLQRPAERWLQRQRAGLHS